MNDIIIFIVGIISGIIGTTMGGSMLIIVPFLISLGLSPYHAIATANFSLIGGFFTGGLKFNKTHTSKIKRIQIKLLILSIIGTILGILTLRYLSLTINEVIINKVVLLFLIIILIITLFKEKIFKIKEKKIDIGIKGFLIFLLLSFYGGLFGVGNGIFIIFALVNIIGLTYLNSTGIMTIISLFTTIISALIFYLDGAIDFSIGIPFFLGISLGGILGANLAIKKGDKLLKKLFLIITVIMIVVMGINVLYK